MAHSPLPQPGTDAAVSDRVSEVVARFADRYGDALAVPEAAHDMCVPVSEAFVAALADAGVEAALVSGVQMGEFRGMPVVLRGHFAVQVGEKVFDWTARQFDPHAPVPVVEPVSAWRDRWPALGT